MIRVNFKLPDEVYHTMVFKAKALNINNTEFIKNLIMEQNIINKASRKNNARELGLLGNLTNNINQIAKTLNIANLEGSLKDVDYENIMNILTIIENNTITDIKERYNDK